MQLGRLGEQGRQTAILEERNRVAREIHDTLAPGFTSILMQLEATESALETARPELALSRWAGRVSWRARAWPRPGARSGRCARRLWSASPSSRPRERSLRLQRVAQG